MAGRILPSLPFPSLPFPSLPFPSLPFAVSHSLLVGWLLSLSLSQRRGRSFVRSFVHSFTVSAYKSTNFVLRLFVHCQLVEITYCVTRSHSVPINQLDSLVHCHVSQISRCNSFTVTSHKSATSTRSLSRLTNQSLSIVHCHVSQISNIHSFTAMPRKSADVPRRRWCRINQSVSTTLLDLSTSVQRTTICTIGIHTTTIA